MKGVKDSSKEMRDGRNNVVMRSGKLKFGRRAERGR